MSTNMHAPKNKDAPADIPLAVLNSVAANADGQRVSESAELDIAAVNNLEAVNDPIESQDPFRLDKHGLWSLAAQHLSRSVCLVHAKHRPTLV